MLRQNILALVNDSQIASIFFYIIMSIFRTQRPCTVLTTWAYIEVSVSRRKKRTLELEVMDIFFSLFFVLKLSFIFIMDAALCLMGCAGLSRSLTEECVQKDNYQNWKRLLKTSFCPFANQQ